MTARNDIKLVPLEPGCYYHIFNRTNNKERLFRNDENKRFFLSKYQLYLNDYVDSYAHCLLKNHFHILVRIKEQNEIQQHIRGIPDEDKTVKQRNMDKKWQASGCIVEGDIYSIVSAQFRRLFLSYSKAYNKACDREGNLFNRPFKRKKVVDENYLKRLAYYIHSNPTHHTPDINFMEYKWSSYQTLLTNKETYLQRDTVMNWFGGRGGFLDYHERAHLYDYDEQYFIDV